MMALLNEQPEQPEQPEPKARAWFSSQVSLILVITAIVAFLAGLGFAEITDSPYNDDEFEIFWNSWEILEGEYYYDLPQETDLIYGAIQGLLSTTGDRYTFFSPPIYAEYSRQETAGEFGGIGAYVSMTQAGQLVITEVAGDKPAQVAGLRVGDAILAVDGVEISGWLLEDALGVLRGEIGSQVTLTIFRAAENEEFVVELTRVRIEALTVVAKTYDNIGYLRLFLFNHNATSSLEREIAALQEQGVAALILDLRGNPGGLLDQAVSVSDLFLPEGVVVTQRNRDGDQRVYRSENGDLAEDIPLVVLIDSESASASEVVAGALRDRDRALLIGETSFGKGSVQHVFDLKDGSQIRVTAAVWFTPNETPINDQGLEPDVPITVLANGNPENDPFIAAALDYLEQQIEQAGASAASGTESSTPSGTANAEKSE